MNGESAPLIGRDHHLERILGLVEQAAHGQPSVVLVEGSPGIGKTRLLRELTGRLDGHATLLTGGAVSIGGDDLPYAAIAAALRRTDARWPPPIDPDDPVGRLRVLESLLDVLGDLSTDRPLVVGLEDLHWADPSTRGAVDFLARNLSDERVVIVGTARVEELERGHPWRAAAAELARLDRVVTVRLEPLDADQSAALAAHHLGGELDPAGARMIWERGQGNPFYTEELARARVTGEAGLPATLSAVLERQVEQLPDRVLRVLRVAAVVGRGMAPDLVADVADIEPDLAEDALRAASDAGFVVPSEAGLMFRHALLREAVASSLLPSERRGLHAAVARRFEAHDDGTTATAAAIARHWNLAGDLPRAHAAARRAAEMARRTHDHFGALQQFEIAVETFQHTADTGDDPRNGTDGLVRLLLETAEVARRAGALDRAVAVARRAEELGRDVDDVDLRIQTVTSLAISLRDSVDYQGAWVVIGSAVDDFDAATDDVHAAAVAAAASVAAAAGWWDDTVRLGTQGVELARRTGRKFEEARSLGALGVASVVFGKIDQGRTQLSSAEEIAHEVGEAHLGAALRANHVQVLYHLGMFEECARFAASGIEVARELGLVRTLGTGIAGVGALAAMHLADVDGARSMLDRPPPDGPGLPSLMFHIATARLALIESDHERASRMLDRAAQMAGDGLHLFAPDWAAVRLELAIVEDDPVPGALDAAEIGGRADAAVLLSSGWWMVNRIEAVLLARVVDDPVFAETLTRLRDHALSTILAIRDLGRATVVLPPWMAAAEAIGGRGDGSARADTAEVLDALTRHGLAAERDWVTWGLAARALAAGRRDEGAVALAALLDDETTTPVVRRLAEDLATRARLVRADVEQGSAAAAYALTAREVEVLSLVAAGLTNRELAERLYISPKTASVHVTNLMRKLGATDRRAAAAIARRLGLVEV